MIPRTTRIEPIEHNNAKVRKLFNTQNPPILNEI
ncbi:hypothetical protein SAMN05880501_12042 [Ureibacillus xyleni]|uniref:Uncharacterized protein n=1 Tax=Ureibacillus xyleni TaxID=614648 RepID=A0A285TSD1_9BACL|nr:hypothetical protein SAMN05880501_12042 [Ureibacillus xyleni]